MENLDLRVLADVLAWKQGGHAVTLVTLLETWGTSPRPAGGLLALRDDGAVSGSGVGGHADDDLTARTRAALQLAPPSTLPSEVIHALTQQEAEQQGLPCGGNLRLVREPVLDTAWITELLQRTAEHGQVLRSLSLATGAVTLAAGNGPAERLGFDGLTLTRQFGPPWRVLVVGASELGQAVAAMALQLDFRVCICDPRPGYGPARDVAGVQRLTGEPFEAVREAAPDSHTAVVAVSHEPSVDDPALFAALQSDAFYVGALGSRRNQEMRRQRMAERFGATDAQSARIFGPAGLKLGGRTPPEMALSILAELVQVRHGLAAPVA